jgi:thiol-disulfide isomerase/thioredoxin
VVGRDRLATARDALLHLLGVPCGTDALPMVICSLRHRCAGVLVLALTVSACGLQPDISERNLDPSLTQLPPLSGPTIDGGSYTLAQHGHPAVVDFWASWCGPCRKQQPELDALARCYAPRGVTFIGVDIRDDRANGMAYVREFGVPYPSLDDPGSAIAGQFDVSAPPTTLVADGRGRVVLERLGGITRADVGPTLARLLEGSSPSASSITC